MIPRTAGWLLGLAVLAAPIGSAEPPPQNVVLVTIDGVRWQDVFDAEPSNRSETSAARVLLPNIYRRLIDGGASAGDPDNPMIVLNTSCVSLPGYREMFGGRVDADCSDNDCPPWERETAIGVAARHFGADNVAVIASWPGVADALGKAPPDVPISAGRWTTTHEHFSGESGLSAHVLAGDWSEAEAGNGFYRPDEVTGPLALRYLEHYRPRLLVIGLGDTDEWGHEDNASEYMQSLRNLDGFIASLYGTLTSMGEYGRSTVVILTTDHGRNEGLVHHSCPESARVWLAAGGPGIVPGAQIAGATLSDVGPTVLSLLGLDARELEPAGTPMAAVAGAQPPAADIAARPGALSPLARLSEWLLLLAAR